MVSGLIEIDEYLFHLINGVWHHPWLDGIMPLWRDKYFWVPLYWFLLFFLILNFKRWGLFLFLAALVTIGISDQLSSKIIKPTVQRMRPCKTPSVNENMRLLMNCSSGYSFPSSHATNHFALAWLLVTTLGRFVRKIRIPLLLWAASIAYGQVYVGVHFPVDVIAGTLLGTAVGLGVAYLFDRFFPAENYSIQKPLA